jgi:type VI protein secretion system component Hcp
MAIDAYVKFGESGDTGGPENTPLPLIEGDSDDAHHYWWCELRDCGFDLEAAERNADAEGDKEKEKPKRKFPKVTMQKRVDWASTQLFIKCCEAAESTTKKTDDDDAKGVIDQVTVEVCRPAGGDKIPFVTVKYFNVRVTHFSVAMDGPEPSESIEFEFEELVFEYRRTDPYTGKEVQGRPAKTGRLANDAGNGSPGSSGGGDSGAGPASPAAGTAGAATPSAGAGAVATPAGANGAHAGLASSTELAVSVNYPGYLGGNGFGLLPD